MLPHPTVLRHISKLLRLCILDLSSGQQLLYNYNTHKVTPADSRIILLSILLPKKYAQVPTYASVKGHILLLKTSQQCRTIYKVCMHSYGLFSVLVNRP